MFLLQVLIFTKIVITIYIAVLTSDLCRVVDFDEFLDLVIAQQGDSRDVYDEILQGFKMFDYGKGIHLIFVIDNFSEVADIIYYAIMLKHP